MERNIGSEFFGSFRQPGTHVFVRHPLLAAGSSLVQDKLFSSVREFLMEAHRVGRLYGIDTNSLLRAPHISLVLMMELVSKMVDLSEVVLGLDLYGDVERIDHLPDALVTTDRFPDTRESNINFVGGNCIITSLADKQEMGRLDHTLGLRLINELETLADVTTDLFDVDVLNFLADTYRGDGRLLNDWKLANRALAILIDRSFCRGQRRAIISFTIRGE